MCTLIGRTRFLFRGRVDFRESAAKKATPEKPVRKVSRESKANPDRRDLRDLRARPDHRESRGPKENPARRVPRGSKENEAKPEQRSGSTLPDRGKTFLCMMTRRRTSASSIRIRDVFI